MNRIEFENRLLVWGGNLDGWPAAEADAARRLLLTDPESNHLLGEMNAVDHAVRLGTVKPLDAALIGRIMAATQVPSAQWRVPQWKSIIPAGALAILIFASAGFKAGYDDGLGRASELDLAIMVTGDAYSEGRLP